ncbi:MULTISPECIES: hypothetical protein [Pseudomonas]|uniref:Uncharacterized protein n=1 Tax=Pseudomonas umsongensis TaxID=198618 RepID=A0ACC5MAH2_9PSED|nr:MULTISPECIES: hypothetical protein [Pseudomonas]MBB2885630.1 hypothetical protein [Pseudomonas umsongensis]NMN79566.1 hypothetical protein [Pseudomonas sp. KD5]
MTNDSIPKARTFWEEKDYLSSVRVGLTTELPSKYKNSGHFAEVLLNLAYALYSASEANLYNEFTRIFPKYMALVAPNIHSEPPIGYHNHACLMQHNLKAVIFQYYENTCSIDEVRAAEELLVRCTTFTPNPSALDEQNTKLLGLVGLIQAGKDPYFTVAFKLPFALPLPDGKYEVTHPGGKMTISVEGFVADDVSSRVDDRHFSRVEVTAKGFTCTDNYWSGPNIESDQTEPWNRRLALSVVNRVVLESKLVDESLRIVMASSRDIGNIATTQYDGDGATFHLSIALTFGGFSLVDTLSRQQVTPEKCQLLTERLSVGEMAMHENLYAQALIQRGTENLVGAYYLLNSAAEAMIDCFLVSLCEKFEVSDKLSRFLLGESICVSCELFKAAPVAIDTPRSANPPSAFQRFKFLKEVGVAKSADVRSLIKSLVTVRSDSLRNDLSHGRKDCIPSVAVDKAIVAFRELRSTFQALSIRDE